MAGKKTKKSSKSKVASFRNTRRKPVAKRNSALSALGVSGGAVENLAVTAGFGVGGYVSTRLGGKFLRVLVGSRVAGGRFAKHFTPVGSLATLIALWYASGKWQKARPHRESILVGSAVALVQALLQTYLPGLVGIIDGQPALGDYTSNGSAAARFRRGVNGKRRGNGANGVRYVSPGELESEDALRNERADRAEANEVQSESAHVDDEVAADDPNEPLSDEEAAIRQVVEENAELGDLYDGVFAKN